MATHDATINVFMAACVAVKRLLLGLPCLAFQLACGQLNEEQAAYLLEQAQLQLNTPEAIANCVHHAWLYADESTLEPGLSVGENRDRVKARLATIGLPCSEVSAVGDGTVVLRTRSGCSPGFGAEQGVVTKDGESVSLSISAGCQLKVTSSRDGPYGLELSTWSGPGGLNALPNDPVTFHGRVHEEPSSLRVDGAGGRTISGQLLGFVLEGITVTAGNCSPRGGVLVLEPREVSVWEGHKRDVELRVDFAQRPLQVRIEQFVLETPEPPSRMACFL